MYELKDIDKYTYVYFNYNWNVKIFGGNILIVI